jgi:glycosyltransferase involved in cell wall biosynthesis
MASEGVPLVVVQAVGGRRPRKLFDVEDVDRWCARGDVGADPVVPAMAKIVGFCGKGVPGLAAGRVVWNTFGGGGGYVLSGPPSSAAVHEIAALEGVVVPLGRDDPRPQVLLVTPLSGGAFALVMWLLRGLENEFRCTVFLVEAARGDEHRIRAMSELAAEVYPVAGFLDPMVWPSLAADLVRTRGFTAVLRVGRGFEFSPSDDVRPHVVDLPLDSSEVAPGARVVLALGRGIAGAATAGGATVIPLASAPAVPADPPDPESTVSIRSAFGIPDDHRLVITICDLAAEHRPEDVAAVAHRLHHRRDTHFLLVGEGDLGGTVSDIARYFGLENFTMAPHTHDLHDLIMAADVVLITAERDPWSVPAAAALALGRHLVATDVDGRQELVDACGGDRHALVAPGDVGGLAAAVEAAVDARPRPRATKKAWKAAGARSDQNLRVVADVLRGDKGGSKGDD